MKTADLTNLFSLTKCDLKESKTVINTSLNNLNDLVYLINLASIEVTWRRLQYKKITQLNCYWEILGTTTALLIFKHELH